VARAGPDYQVWDRSVFVAGVGSKLGFKILGIKRNPKAFCKGWWDLATLGYSPAVSIFQ